MTTEEVIITSIASIFTSVIGGVITVMYEYRIEAKRGGTTNNETEDGFRIGSKIQNPSKFFKIFIPVTVALIFISIILILFLSSSSGENISLESSITLSGIIYLGLTSYQLSPNKPPFLNYVKVILIPSSLLLIWSMNFFESVGFIAVFISILAAIYEENAIDLDRNLSLLIRLILIPFTMIFMSTVSEINIFISLFLSTGIWVVPLIIKYAILEETVFHDIVIFQKDNESRKKHLLEKFDKEASLKDHNWIFIAVPALIFFAYTLHLKISGTPKQNRIQKEYEETHGYKESRDTTYTNLRYGWTRISIERYSMKGGFYSEVFLEHEDGTVLDKVYEEIRNFSRPHGLAAVKMNGYFGFIDTTGAEVIPCQFDEVGGFTSKGVSYAIKSREIGKKNEWVFDTIYINTEGKQLK